MPAADVLPRSACEASRSPAASAAIATAQCAQRYRLAAAPRSPMDEPRVSAKRGMSRCTAEVPGNLESARQCLCERTRQLEERSQSFKLRDTDAPATFKLPPTAPIEAVPGFGKLQLEFSYAGDRNWRHAASARHAHHSNLISTHATPKCVQASNAPNANSERESHTPAGLAAPELGPVVLH